MKKKALLLLVVIGAIAALSACSKPLEVSFEPTETSLFAQRDGGVTACVKEDGYDKDYYSEDELKNDFVVPQVTQYNSDKSKLAFAYAKDTKEILPISIDTLTIADGTATLILEYQTADDYLAYNQDVIGKDHYFCVAKANKATLSDGYNAKWIKVSDKSSITQEEAMKEKYFFVGLDFASTVKVEGKILYTSDNVTVKDDYTFVSDGEKPAYVIFRQ